MAGKNIGSNDQKSRLKAEFAKRLQARLDELGWNQSDLARKIGMHRDNISHYLRQVTLPRRPVLEKIAQAVGMTPEALLPMNEESSQERAVEFVLGKDGRCHIRIDVVVSAAA